MEQQKMIFELSGDTYIELVVCPVCGIIGDGEIFKATHFGNCTYVAYRVNELLQIYNGR